MLAENGKHEPLIFGRKMKEAIPGEQAIKLSLQG
jgi:hypothetical protein